MNLRDGSDYEAAWDSFAQRFDIFLPGNDNYRRATRSLE